MTRGFHHGVVPQRDAPPIARPKAPRWAGLGIVSRHALVSSDPCQQREAFGADVAKHAMVKAAGACAGT